MTRALLVIDVQNDYFSGRHTITYPVDSFANIQRAMDVAAGAGIPIVLVRHSARPAPGTIAGNDFAPGSHGWEFPPEIGGRPHDIVMEKTLPGSFTGTAAGGVAAGPRNRYSSDRGLYDADVLRYYLAAGSAPGLWCRVPFGCHRHSRLRQLRRQRYRRGASPRRAGSAGIAVRESYDRGRMGGCLRESGFMVVRRVFAQAPTKGLSSAYLQGPGGPSAGAGARSHSTVLTSYLLLLTSRTGV